MSVDRIELVDDTRVQRCSTILNGTTYGYLLAVPESGEYRDTIFLFHGFPDISMGWRYQIPALLKLGLRVVAPDCLGYGRTDAPEFTAESASRYGFKQCADDMKELARQLGSSHVILGGHDWGGFIVYRIALYYPEFVTHIFSVCTPYSPPQKEFIPLDQVIARIPFFGYQKYLASGEVEKAIRTKTDIRQFLLSVYGGLTPKGEFGFDVNKGALLDKLPHMQLPPFVSEEELDHITEEFARNGIHGPLNWYRTREQNYKDELQIVGRTIDVPVLFIMATKDIALRPELSVGMEKYFKNLRRDEVEATHWALWEKPAEVNAIMKRWFEEVVFDEKAKL